MFKVLHKILSRLYKGGGPSGGTRRVETIDYHCGIIWYNIRTKNLSKVVIHSTKNFRPQYVLSDNVRVPDRISQVMYRNEYLIYLYVWDSLYKWTRRLVPRKLQLLLKTPTRTKPGSTYGRSECVEFWRRTNPGVLKGLEWTSVREGWEERERNLRIHKRSESWKRVRQERRILWKIRLYRTERGFTGKEFTGRNCE